MEMCRVASLAVLLVVTVSIVAQDPCRGKGSLAARLNLNIAINDANGDSVVTGQEIEDDLTKNYDTNNDGCVTRQEWVNRWVAIDFSSGYANARFNALGVKDTNNPCPIDVKGFARTSIPIDAFIQGNVQTLVDLCQGNVSLYQTNCDCYQLKDTCARDNFFKHVKACQDLTRTGHHTK